MNAFQRYKNETKINNINDNICFENIENIELSKFREFFVKFDKFHQLKIQIFNRNICQNHFKLVFWTEFNWEFFFSKNSKFVCWYHNTNHRLQLYVKQYNTIYYFHRQLKIVVEYIFINEFIWKHFSFFDFIWNISETHWFWWWF